MKTETQTLSLWEIERVIPSMILTLSSLEQNMIGWEKWTHEQCDQKLLNQWSKKDQEWL